MWTQKKKTNKCLYKKLEINEFVNNFYKLKVINLD
jgi:hypothetical protein